MVEVVNFGLVRRVMGKVIQGAASSQLDTVKWIIVWALILLAAVGNLYYSDQFSVFVRVSVLLVLGLLALLCASLTTKGRIVWRFIKEARSEMRKIVWPTRQETLQTTAVVSVFVLIMSLVLWGVDVLFASLISRIVG